MKLSLIFMIHMSPPKRVSEAVPVQVYLDRQSRDRLDRLAEQLELTRSDVLRRGLIALERESSDPSQHPVLKLVAARETGSAPHARMDGKNQRMRRRHAHPIIWKL